MTVNVTISGSSSIQADGVGVMQHPATNFYNLCGGGAGGSVSIYLYFIFPCTYSHFNNNIDSRRYTLILEHLPFPTIPTSLLTEPVSTLSKRKGRIRKYKNRFCI